MTEFFVLIKTVATYDELFTDYECMNFNVLSHQTIGSSLIDNSKRDHIRQPSTSSRRVSLGTLGEIPEIFKRFFKDSNSNGK